MIPRMKQDEGLNATINTTEDCNLRCKYCYEINKRNKSINIEYAKKFIDMLVDDDDPVGFNGMADPMFNEKVYQKGILLDFIGGDSLMDVKILDEIFTYFTQKIWMSNTKNAIAWRSHHRFNISSNGTLFLKKEVQDFILKWKNNLQISVSLDGCPEIHDKNRIMLERGKNGEEIGSMQYILKGWSWYRSIFPFYSLSTKATCSKENIPYLLKSIQFLFEEMGIININMNFIMEDMQATDEDYRLFDKEMRKCVEYVLQHRHELYWGMLDYTQFARHRLSKEYEWNCTGHCGSGAMPCLGINGNVYPCFRWAPHTQSKENPEPIIVGDVKRGMYNKDGFNKVRSGAFRNNCTREEKCRKCIYESACAYCIGGCYAEHQDFIRNTYICEFTKIQSKWAKVYWNEYSKLEGKPMQFNEFFQLDRVPEWTKPMSVTNELDI